TRLANPPNQPSRPHHRTQQPSSRNSIAKIESVRNNPPHTQMPRQRTHHMVQPLAHQHHIHAGRLQGFQVPHSFFFEQRLQLIFEFFRAQQIEPVARNPSQHAVNDPSR